MTVVTADSGSAGVRTPSAAAASTIRCVGGAVQRAGDDDDNDDDVDDGAFWPWGVAVVPSGNVVVCDFHNHAVFVEPAGA